MGDSMHTVLLLQQISQQLAGISKSSTNTALPSYPLCQPTPSTVLSLCFGLRLRQLLYSNGLVIASRLLSVDQLRIKKHELVPFSAKGWRVLGWPQSWMASPRCCILRSFCFVFFCRPCWPSFREQPPHHLQHIGYCLSLCYVISYCYISTSHPPLLSLQNPTVRCLLVDTTVLRPTPIHRWERQSEEYKWW